MVLQYKIAGRVKDEQGKPLSGLFIDAFDSDIGTADDHLGNATTDSQGEFGITFDDKAFKGAIGILERRPDEYLIVRDASRVLHRTEVRSEANDEEFFNITIKDVICSISQPMFCSAERLEAMYDQSKNRFLLEALINADENSPPAQRWSFDKNTLMIYNNKYWRGFFPVDQSLTFIRYAGGFWKRFYKEAGKIKGITHPFETPVEAPNIPGIQNYPGFGEVIHLKYTGIEFKLFYDLLKMVDKDTILGKAFFGVPPFGTRILTFSMSRRYGVDFMTEEDHETIFQQYARAPEANEVIGRWEGKLVSDSALTPIVQVFTYARDQAGKLQMEYVFGGLLQGISRVELTPQQMKMYDYTNWHDEVKIVTNDFMIGKWCSPWTQIPLIFGPSFLSVEKGPEGSRFSLRFTLKRA